MRCDRAHQSQHPDHDTQAWPPEGAREPPNAPWPLSGDRALCVGHARCVTATASMGDGGIPKGKPAVFLHGGPAAAPTQNIGGSSIRRATACCCSTSEAAGARRRMRSWREYDLAPWTDIERLRELMASTNGWCSAAPGAPAGAGLCRDASGAGERACMRGIFTLRASSSVGLPVRESLLFPTNGSVFSAVPQEERADLKARIGSA